MRARYRITRGLYVDSLSLIMTLIIGLVGAGICIYSIGYMEDFQAEHKHEADRRPRFFALMFIFLAAMYAIIFCNNLIWLYAGWEITTVCSFLLIGYTRTEEAIANAFRPNRHEHGRRHRISCSALLHGARVQHG